MLRASRRLLFAAAAAAALLAMAGCGDGRGPSPQPSAVATEAPPLPTFAPTGSVVCSEEAHDPASADGAWTHPSQNFYGPDEKLPTEADLQHLIASDSAVIVRYRSDATPENLETLREFAGKPAAIVVLPGETRDNVAVEAFTSNRRLLCDGVDPEQLTAFADRRGLVSSSPHDDMG